jgi:hypothetical protein
MQRMMAYRSFAVAGITAAAGSDFKAGAPGRPSSGKSEGEPLGNIPHTERLPNPVRDAKLATDMT